MWRTSVDGLLAELNKIKKERAQEQAEKVTKTKR